MYNEVRNIAPFINTPFRITSPWWTYRDDPLNPGTTTLHRGLDIATGADSTVYSMLTGIVHTVSYSASRGNYVIIKDNNPASPTYGYATMYMHLKDGLLVVQGQSINVGDPVGIEGATGEVTGRHLHVEMQDLNRWGNVWHISNNQSDYINVPEFMGIDNIQYTWWIYDGTPTPPIIPDTKKKKFPWVLYAKKLRTKY